MFDIHGLPRIETLRDLAAHTQFSSRRLWLRLFANSENYTTFRLPKKSGGYRHIAHPNGPLKAVQRWILKNILDKLHTTTNCHGFVRGSKLRHHAEQHIGANSILSLDIENFFPSISVAQITNVFRVAGYCSAAASMLARLCTYLGALPQGAPSSPKLANLTCSRMDRRLAGFAAEREFVYTRYADDMSFSGASASALAKAKAFIAHIIKDSGFRLNPGKTRLAGPGRALKITGLIVSSDGVGIGRQVLRKMRARIHQAHSGASNVGMGSIQGWLDFVSDVDPDRYRMLVEYIERLQASSVTSSLNALRIRHSAA